MFANESYTCTRFADWVTIWVVHFPGRTETSGSNYRIIPDSASRAWLQYLVLNSYLRLQESLRVIYPGNLRV